MVVGLGGGDFTWDDTKYVYLIIAMVLVGIQISGWSVDQPTKFYQIGLPIPKFQISLMALIVIRITN